MNEVYDFLFAMQVWGWGVGIAIVASIICCTVNRFCPRFVDKLMKFVFGED